MDFVKYSGKKLGKMNVPLFPFLFLEFGERKFQNVTAKSGQWLGLCVPIIGVCKFIHIYAHLRTNVYLNS